MAEYTQRSICPTQPHFGAGGRCISVLEAEGAAPVYVAYAYRDYILGYYTTQAEAVAEMLKTREYQRGYFRKAPSHWVATMEWLEQEAKAQEPRRRSHGPRGS